MRETWFRKCPNAHGTSHKHLHDIKIQYRRRIHACWWLCATELGLKRLPISLNICEKLTKICWILRQNLFSWNSRNEKLWILKYKKTADDKNLHPYLYVPVYSLREMITTAYYERTRDQRQLTTDCMALQGLHRPRLCIGSVSSDSSHCRVARLRHKNSQYIFSF